MGSRAILTLRKQCFLCCAAGRTKRRYKRNRHTLPKDNGETADIVISGGGMVGGALACALGHEELLNEKRIVLLEASPQRQWSLPSNYSNRTCAINPSSVNLFNSFGAWDEVLQMRCQPVKRMQVWDSCSESLIAFNNVDLFKDLAYIVENDVLQEAVKRRLDSITDRVHVRYGTLAKNVVIPGTTPGHEGLDENSWITLHLNDGTNLRTKLLVGADGMNSAVRKAGEFHTVSYDYKQAGVVATLELSGEVENTVAWQRFLPTGPIAMLPLSNKYSNLIWSTTLEESKHLKTLSAESFVDAVNDAFFHDRDTNQVAISAGRIWHKVLNTVTPEGSSVKQIPPSVVGVDSKSIASFPLSLIHASNYVKHRVALIGDAAHRIHPLAGQGVNLGFGDVACLRDLLVECVSKGADVGSLTHLKEYETQRQREVLPVAGTVSFLQKLYGTDSTPVVLLRSLGLQSVNSLPFFKDYIIQRASS